MAASLRLAVAGAIALLLLRSARVAWRNRRLALAVWRRIRPRHVLGGAVLLLVVVGVAVALLQLVPLTRVGLGSAIGLHGNAVFAPVQEVAVRTGEPAPGPAGAPRASSLRELAVTGGTTAFLVGLLLLFPWLAYVEERTFRAGLETAGPARELATALRFGLLHLLMLIPLAAALALAVSGFAYGRVYRRAYRRAAARAEVVDTPSGPVTLAPAPAQVQAAAVLEATVWHATCNSLIVLLLLAAFLVDRLA